MENSNASIQGLLGTARSTPSQSSKMTNPAMKNIATNGKQMLDNIGNLTKAVNNLTKVWGG